MRAHTRTRSVVAMTAALLMVLSGIALAAIQFEQASMNMTNPNSGNAATSLVIPKPAGLAAGDFMLAQITYEKGSDAGTSASFTPAGWTLLNRRNESTDLGQAIFYKFAAASDVSASGFSFSFSQSVKAAGAILRYTGVHPTNPIIDSSANSGQSGTLTATSVNAEADSVAVALFGVKKNTTLSLPDGMTSRVDFANPQDVKIRAADEHRASAGVTGNRTSTPGTGDKWVAHLVTLRQADPPPVTNTAPVYTAAAKQTAETGESKAFQLGSFTDPDQHASWNVTVNWGDGTAEDTFTVTSAGSLGTRTHTYATAGEKTVTVTVSDGIATGSGTFKVDVTTPPPPNTAPTLSLPDDITAPATSAAGAVVTYTATANDVEDGPLTPTCSPASGSTFAVGSTTVNCSVTDSGGLSASGSFKVTVNEWAPPPVVTYSALFGRPLESNGVLNSTKLGRVVPVKVEVLGSDGSEDRSGPVSFQTRKVSCTAGAGVDPIDEFVAAGSSNTGNQFRWDADGDHWVFNLDTGRIGAKGGECHQLDIYQGGTALNGTVTGGTHIGSVRLTFTK